ncbi:hypothetical protein ACFOHS_04010 [Jhaorihella thermophila]
MKGSAARAADPCLHLKKTKHFTATQFLKALVLKVFAISFGGQICHLTYPFSASESSQRHTAPKGGV